PKVEIPVVKEEPKVVVPPVIISDAGVSPPEYIVVRETPEGKIVENTIEGYEVTVPKEWKIDATKTQFYTPMIDQENGRCKITQGINQGETTVDKIKQDMEASILDTYNIEDLEVKKYEVVKIAEHEALKSTIKTYMGYAISTHVPINKKDYYFIMYFNPTLFNECTDYLDKFLKTIKFL
ncbi:MAG: hypothetical protein V1649_01215, partial [Patescibacteria group bacterium]